LIKGDWSSDVCSSDLPGEYPGLTVYLVKKERQLQ
jgi:hypothetical protein